MCFPPLLYSPLSCVQCQCRTIKFLGRELQNDQVSRTGEEMQVSGYIVNEQVTLHLVRTLSRVSLDDNRWASSLVRLPRRGWGKVSAS